MSFRYDFMFIIIFILVAIATVIFPLVPVFKKVTSECGSPTCAGVILDTYYVTFRTFPQMLKNEPNLVTPSYKLFDMKN